MKKSDKKSDARKPAKASGGSTKTTKRTQTRLGDDELSKVAGGDIMIEQRKRT
jgi:hypothetical protein